MKRIFKNLSLSLQYNVKFGNTAKTIIVFVSNAIITRKVI